MAGRNRNRYQKTWSQKMETLCFGQEPVECCTEGGQDSYRTVAPFKFWKVQKVVPIDWKKMKFKQVELSDEEKMTRLIDAEGMKYLSYILYPLCIAGAVYSLFYQQYKSWYSWLIHSLVNGVYAFGFLFMLPQLFINYKLKSVAHLPWKSFMYKAFNTFIDDLFAFIITMPTAHRLACFRDDVIFIIYLYQRWLYPVDKTRIDESSHLKIE
uniref:Lipid scramblase CLPTM1L n=1 Tax=Rhodnius prolixus TaxID=13249 RepID=T1HF70_RHOPR